MRVLPFWRWHSIHHTLLQKKEVKLRGYEGKVITRSETRDKPVSNFTCLFYLKLNLICFKLTNSELCDIKCEKSQLSRVNHSVSTGYVGKQ